MGAALGNFNDMKYSEYKDSGVEWLGDIPNHWAKIKIKNIANIYNGDSLSENKKAKYESDDESHLAYISSKDIDLDTSLITYQNGLRIPRNEPKYKVAKSHSSLICIEGGSAGRKIAFTDQEVCFVNKLACVSAINKFNSKYLYFTLKGSLFQTQFKLALSGMIGGVAISSINNFYVLAPSIPEQATIADFLDCKTALIDQAIDIKQKQIEFLKERRQILINKAVTRGLNPNVKMTDSGEEWIGEIPEHWAKIKIKYIANIYNGDSLSENKKAKYESNDESHLAYISSKDIDLDTSVITYQNGLRIPRNEPKYKVAKRNSSLICIEGGSAGRKIAFTDQEVCFVNKLACVSAKNKFNSKFLYFTLKGSLFQTQFKLALSGMIGGVAISSINNFYVLAPSIPEQKAIAEFIEISSSKIETAISLKEKEIQRLKEYKATLINSAVTGKIKVYDDAE